MLVDTILQAIGRTPLVKLHKVTAGLDCEVFGKCDFMNPGGSIKDRIAYNMILAAEKAGKIRPGYTLIEPSSGNAGLGIALVGAVRGYKVIITMPEKMSQEKQLVLEALGAKIYRTRTEAAYDDEDSHISLAKRLQQEIPDSFILDQYNNPANPGAHYDSTAEEILQDLDGRIDMVVAGVGTGGTITGLAKRFREVNPHVQIIGVDPYGSILGGGTEIKSYAVEGIGYDFIPKVLDNNLVTEYVKIHDKDAFHFARRLIKEEGLLVGGSSGAAMWACLQTAKKLKSGQRCVVIFPDSIRNYLTKFVNNDWMKEHHFL